MNETTPRFGLPLLAAGQAQKEIDHNEALTMLEALVQPVVQTLGDNAPPASPVAGQSWIVGTAPTGAWAGQAGAVAVWTAGGWRFVAPREGLWLWVAGLGLWARRTATTWLAGALPASSLVVNGVQVVGARGAAVADPTGGTAPDANARAAISQILAALRAHGLIAS